MLLAVLAVFLFCRELLASGLQGVRAAAAQRRTARQRALWRTLAWVVGYDGYATPCYPNSSFG